MLRTPAIMQMDMIHTDTSSRHQMLLSTLWAVIPIIIRGTVHGIGIHGDITIRSGDGAGPARRGHGAGGLLGHGDRHGAHHGAGVPPGGGGRRGDGVVRYGVAQADLITPLQEPMHLTVHINPPELTAIIPTATVLWAATVGR